MKYILLLMPVFLVACSKLPPEAHFARGAPESLLDVSSEVVNLSVGSEASVDELAEWIQQDQPTRAELYCPESSDQCVAAQEALDLYGVPTLYVASVENVASLVYERVLARDCENRYIDNHINPYNLNHPTLGCSVAANMVQMVSDKHQFVRPNLMEPAESYKAVQTYHTYLEKTKTKDEYGLDKSLIDKGKSK